LVPRRNTVLGRVVGQLVEGLPAGYRVLEVGCGNGNVLRVLEEVCADGEVVGMDLVEEKLQFARRRTHCTLRQGDLYRLPQEPFPPHRHVRRPGTPADDREALRSLGPRADGGRPAAADVPAHRTLWSYADTHAGHHRRYSVSSLKQALAESGMRVEYCTQFMSVLFPLMWVGRRIAVLRRKLQSGPRATVTCSCASCALCRW